MKETLRAGVFRVQLPAESGWPMMGYGARTGVADACHDELYARALCVEQGSDALLVVDHQSRRARRLFYEFEVGGVRFQVIAAENSAEGEDALLLWLPDHGILFTGDFYGCL